MSQEIQNLLETYQRGLNEANVDLVRSVYAADAIFIGQPFPTATGVDDIVALYLDFLAKLDFNVQFDVLDIELSDNLGFIRTSSHGAIVPKGQTPEGSEGNREVFVVKKIDGVPIISSAKAPTAYAPNVQTWRPLPSISVQRVQAHPPRRRCIATRRHGLALPGGWWPVLCNGCWGKGWRWRPSTASCQRSRFMVAWRHKRLKRPHLIPGRND